MEGIPPEDVKEHEKQKSGIKKFYFEHLQLDLNVCIKSSYLLQAL